MSISKKDNLYADIANIIEPFQFDEPVATVFDDMIHRSVPGYQIIVNAIADLAKKTMPAGTNCYDLGCSLGTVTLAIRRELAATGCKIVAVDSSIDMIKRCQSLMLSYKSDVPVLIEHSDIQSIHIENASMVVLNFTLQFIEPNQRFDLLKSIYDGLLPGGILVLSEKVNFPDANLNDLMIELHHNFKRENGYSELEVSQKRSALENVLIPDSIELHKQRLEKIGFDAVDVWFQYFNFCSMLAIK